MKDPIQIDPSPYEILDLDFNSPINLVMEATKVALVKKAARNQEIMGASRKLLVPLERAKVDILHYQFEEITLPEEKYQLKFDIHQFVKLQPDKDQILITLYDNLNPDLETEVNFKNIDLDAHVEEMYDVERCETEEQPDLFDPSILLPDFDR